MCLSLFLSQVICAFCVRRFWSAEDLRRHMRTHSGERPFQCDVCSRKFTLKHSMLRHQKKHQRRGGASTQSCSDLSDEETGNQTSRKATPTTTTTTSDAKAEAANNNNGAPEKASAAFSANHLSELMKRSVTMGKALPHQSILGMLMSRELNAPQSEEGATGAGGACDFLANMLGIGDQGLLAKAFQSSPEEAAKLLGVEK